ncbi:MAG: type VI secretion system tip protein VgrG [Polyangiaceae bacterium]|nr:type VI secretion system tip protein VgrG [Polyangiaceae bacterium]
MAIPTLDVRLESDEFDCTGIFVQRLRGSEELSRVFDFNIDIACPLVAHARASELFGATVRLVFSVDGEDVRVVHGLVAEVIDQLAADQPNALSALFGAGARAYRLRIVPRVHRLTLVETQDVFVDMSLPDIIRNKLSLFGFVEGVDFDLRLVRRYPTREFVVQYKESDLAFLQRLTEHLGITFHFEHASGCDMIVFSDNNGAFGPNGSLPAHGYDPRGLASVSSIEHVRKLAPSMFAVQDYNERTPLVDVSGSYELVDGFCGGVVDYAPHALTPFEAQALARVRAEERRVRTDYLDGRSGVMALAAGERFFLAQHPILGTSELLVTELTHDYEALAFSSSSGDGRSSYTNSFRAQPTSVPFRPARVTPKPKISGFVTGLVTPVPQSLDGAALGARESMPKIDAEGRYIVQLHFDTAPPGEPKASCPIRMAQSHAGAGYGMHFPLRPGVEVLIAFLDGDPDRPIIVGAVPNAVTPSPVAASNASLNRIVTASGISINIRDF